MALPANHVESLVTSVLAVNGYPLEKVWNQLPGLRAQRITDAVWVATADLGDVVAHLTASGHERGMLAGMMAERLQSLMVAIASSRLDGLPGMIERRDRLAAAELLRTVKGIGPKVADNALMLLLS